jgi:hypothetical protein
MVYFAGNITVLCMKMNSSCYFAVFYKQVVVQ